MANRNEKIRNILNSYRNNDENVNIGELNLENRSSFGSINIKSSDVKSFNNFMDRYQNDESMYPNGILLTDNPRKVVNDEDIKYTYLMKYNKNRVNERHNEMFPCSSSPKTSTMGAQQLFGNSFRKMGNKTTSNKKSSKNLFIQILMIVSIVFVIIYLIFFWF